MITRDDLNKECLVLTNRSDGRGDRFNNIGARVYSIAELEEKNTITIQVEGHLIMVPMKNIKIIDRG